MAKIGKLIQERRRQLNMSRAEMSRLSTFSPQYLLEIEQGKRVPRRSNTLDIIAKTLELPRDVVYHAAGILPPDIVEMDIGGEVICAAFNSMRKFCS